MLLTFIMSESETLNVLQGLWQSLNDEFLEVCRHERALWVPGMVRCDSGKVGRGQVTEDLGCLEGGRLAEQRHGHGSDLDV